MLPMCIDFSTYGFWLQSLSNTLEIDSWRDESSIKKIVGYCKKEGIKCCLIRKMPGLDNLIDNARKNKMPEMTDFARRLAEFKKNHQGILTPLDENGNQQVFESVVVLPQHDGDSYVDEFLVTDTGRVAKLSKKRSGKNA